MIDDLQVSANAELIDQFENQKSLAKTAVEQIEYYLKSLKFNCGIKYDMPTYPYLRYVDCMSDEIQDSVSDDNLLSVSKAELCSDAKNTFHEILHSIKQIEKLIGIMP